MYMIEVVHKNIDAGNPLFFEGDMVEVVDKSEADDYDRIMEQMSAYTDTFNIIH